jgi:tRNA(Ile2) C34 agmatinyltransferase TiaS
MTSTERVYMTPQGLVKVKRTTHPKCPRCYRHTPEGRSNFDHLCDRCCTTILETFPDHWSAPHIREAHQKCRDMTPAQRLELMEKVF